MLYVHENLCENNILQKIAFFLGKEHNNYLSTITQIQLGPQTNKNVIIIANEDLFVLKERFAFININGGGELYNV
jgi:hypothetical protein